MGWNTGSWSKGNWNTGSWSEVGNTIQNKEAGLIDKAAEKIKKLDQTAAEKAEEFASIYRTQGVQPFLNPPSEYTRVHPVHTSNKIWDADSGVYSTGDKKFIARSDTQEHLGTGPNFAETGLYKGKELPEDQREHYAKLFNVDKSTITDEFVFAMGERATAEKMRLMAEGQATWTSEERDLLTARTGEQFKGFEEQLWFPEALDVDIKYDPNNKRFTNRSDLRTRLYEEVNPITGVNMIEALNIPEYNPNWWDDSEYQKGIRSKYEKKHGDSYTKFRKTEGDVVGTTQYGKPAFYLNGEIVSEKSVTIKVKQAGFVLPGAPLYKFVNVPSIQNGRVHSEEALAGMLERNEISPTSVHATEKEAVVAAAARTKQIKYGDYEEYERPFLNSRLDKNDDGTYNVTSNDYQAFRKNLTEEEAKGFQKIIENENENTIPDEWSIDRTLQHLKGAGTSVVENFKRLVDQTPRTLDGVIKHSENIAENYRLTQNNPQIADLISKTPELQEVIANAEKNIVNQKEIDAYKKYLLDPTVASKEYLESEEFKKVDKWSIRVTDKNLRDYTSILTVEKEFAKLDTREQQYNALVSLNMWENPDIGALDSMMFDLANRKKELFEVLVNSSAHMALAAVPYVGVTSLAVLKYDDIDKEYTERYNKPLEGKQAVYAMSLAAISAQLEKVGVQTLVGKNKILNDRLHKAYISAVAKNPKLAKLLSIPAKVAVSGIVEAASEVGSQTAETMAAHDLDIDGVVLPSSFEVKEAAMAGFVGSAGITTASASVNAAIPDSVNTRLQDIKKYNSMLNDEEKSLSEAQRTNITNRRDVLTKKIIKTLRKQLTKQIPAPSNVITGANDKIDQADVLEEAILTATTDMDTLTLDQFQKLGYEDNVSEANALIEVLTETRKNTDNVARKFKYQKLIQMLRLGLKTNTKIQQADAQLAHALTGTTFEATSPEDIKIVARGLAIVAFQKTIKGIDDQLEKDIESLATKDFDPEAVKKLETKALAAKVAASQELNISRGNAKLVQQPIKIDEKAKQYIGGIDTLGKSYDAKKEIDKLLVTLDTGKDTDVVGNLTLAIQHKNKLIDLLQTAKNDSATDLVTKLEKDIAAANVSIREASKKAIERAESSDSLLNTHTTTKLFSLGDVNGESSINAFKDLKTLIGKTELTKEESAVLALKESLNATTISIDTLIAAADKDMKDVHSEFVHGQMSNKGQLPGLSKHLKRAEAGNLNSPAFSVFINNHVLKSKVFTKAFADVIENSPEVGPKSNELHVYINKTGNEFTSLHVRRGEPLPEEVAKNPKNFWKIHPNSGELVELVQLESELALQTQQLINSINAANLEVVQKTDTTGSLDAIVLELSKEEIIIPTEQTGDISKLGKREPKEKPVVVSTPVTPEETNENAPLNLGASHILSLDSNSLFAEANTGLTVLDLFEINDDKRKTIGNVNTGMELNTANLPDLLEKVGITDPELVTYYTEEFSEFKSIFQDIDPLDIEHLDVPRKDGKKGYNLSRPLSMLYVKDAEGNAFLPDEVIFSIMLGATNWVHQEGNKLIFNTTEDIASIVYHDRHAKILPDDKNIFRRGIPGYMLHQKIGQGIFKSLNIKIKAIPEQFMGTVAAASYDKATESKLEIALGVVALHILKQVKQKSKFKFIKVNHITPVFTYKNSERAISKNDTFALHHFNKGAKKTLAKSGVIFKRNLGAIATLIGEQASFKGMYFTPVETIQKTIPGSFSNTSMKSRDLQFKEQQVGWSLKPTEGLVLKHMDDATIEFFMGVTDHKQEYVEQRDNVRAANDAIKDNILYLREYIELSDSVAHISTSLGVDNVVLEQGNMIVYFEYQIGKTNRLYNTGIGPNGQRSKIDRHFFAPVGNTSTVNNKNSRAIHKLAVAQSFGFDIDKYDVQPSIDFFDEIFDENHKIIDKDLAELVKMTKQLIRGTKVDKKRYNKVLMSFTKNSKYSNKMHALEGVASLAVYRRTVSFDTDMTLEIDGITNGYAISKLQLLGEEVTLLQTDLGRVGITMKGAATYEELLAQRDIHGNKTFTDTYQTFGGYIKDNLQLDIINKQYAKAKSKVRVTKEAIEALERIHGSIRDKDNVVTAFARELAKNPFMVSNYGASLYRILINVSAEVEANFFTTLRDIELEYLQGGVHADSAKVKVKQLEKDIQVLTKSKGKIGLYTALVKGELREKKFDKKFREKLKFGVTSIYRIPFDAGLTKLLGPTIKRRDTLIKLFDVASNMFAIDFKDSKDLFKETNGRNPNYNEIKAIVYSLLDTTYPQYKGPWADTNTFIDGVKTKKGGGGRVAVNVQPFSTVHKERKVGEKDKEIASFTPKELAGYIASLDFESPGVAIIINAIHNMDAVLMGETQMTANFLAIFDATVVALKDVEKVSEVYDKNVLKISKEHRIVNVMVDEFTRVLEAFTEGLDEAEVTAKLLRLKEMQEESSYDATHAKPKGSYVFNLQDIIDSGQVLVAQVESEMPIFDQIGESNQLYFPKNLKAPKEAKITSKSKKADVLVALRGLYQQNKDDEIQRIVDETVSFDAPDSEREAARKLAESSYVYPNHNIKAMTVPELYTTYKRLKDGLPIHTKIVLPKAPKEDAEGNVDPLDQAKYEADLESAQAEIAYQDMSMQQETDAQDAQNDKEKTEYQRTSNVRRVEITDDIFLSVQAKLKELYPEISTEMVENLRDEYGDKVLGSALGGLIQYSTNPALDTLPHEYGHIYVNILESTPLMRKTIELVMEEHQLDVTDAKEFIATHLGERFIGWESMSTRLKNYLKDILRKYKKLAIEALVYLIAIMNGRREKQGLSPFYVNIIPYVNKLKRMLKKKEVKDFDELGLPTTVALALERVAYGFIGGRSAAAIRFKHKKGYTQMRMDPILRDNPAAADLLLDVLTTFPDSILTGSIALSEQGSVYRQGQGDLHDMDIRVSTETMDGSDEFFDKMYPGSQFVHGFLTTDKTHIRTWLVPLGDSSIVNVQRYKGKSRTRVESYEIVDNATGAIIGTYKADLSAKSILGFATVVEAEHFTGERAVLVDFMESGALNDAFVSYSKILGEEIRLAPAKGIFEAKYRIVEDGVDAYRAKDIQDFIFFKPETATGITDPGIFKKEVDTLYSIPVDNVKVLKDVDALFNEPNLLLSIDSINGYLKERDSVDYIDNSEQIKHSEHLDSVLNSLIKSSSPELHKVHFKAFEVEHVSDTGVEFSHGMFDDPTNTIAVNLLDDVPFTYSEQSNQEVYTHEIVHSISFKVLSTNIGLQRHLRELHAYAKQHITVEDFLYRNAEGKIEFRYDEAAERRAAERQYNYLFRDIKADVIPHEFLAYGLTNKFLVGKLRTLKYKRFSWDKNKTTVSNFLEKIVQLFVEVVKIFADAFTDKGFKRANVHGELQNTLSKIVKINAKRRQGAKKHILNVAWRKGFVAGNFVIGKTVKSLVMISLYLMQRNSVKNLTKRMLKEHGADAATIKNSDIRKATESLLGKFHEDLKAILKRIKVLPPQQAERLVLEDEARGLTMSFQKEVRALLSSIGVELTGSTPKELVNAILQIKKNKDETRKFTKEEYAIALIEGNLSYDNKKNKIPKKLAEDVYTAIMETDFVALLGDFSKEEAINLLTDNKALAEAIDKYSKKVNLNNNMYYKTKVKALVDILVTGETTVPSPLLNTSNIVKLYAKKYNKKGVLNTNDEANLDTLVTLKALALLPKEVLDNVAEFAANERAINSEENGINNLLGHLISFKADSLEQLFDGEKAHTIKGYVTDITNPETSLRVAPISESRVMLKKGYKLLKHAGTSGVLPDIRGVTVEPMGLYQNKMDPTLAKAEGIFSTSIQGRRGQLISELLYDAYAEDPFIVPNKLRKFIKQQEILEKHSLTGKKGKQTSQLIPLYDSKLNIVDYRIMMNHENKRENLQQDTNYINVFSTMRSHLVDKVATRKYNAENVKVLVRDGRNYTEGNRDYVNIFSDEYAYVTLNMLPSSTRHMLLDEAMAPHGKPEFWVKRKSLDIFFGSVPPTIANIPGLRSIPYTAKILKGTESIAKATVRMAVVNIVVKIWDVLQANVVSNFIFSVLRGANPVFVLREQKNALLEHARWQKDTKELEQLILKAKAYPNKASKLKNRAAKLLQNIRSNPVDKFMTSGLFVSYTEEILQNEYNYSNQVANYLNEKFPKITKWTSNSSLGWLFQNSYMTEKSLTYKPLLQSLQISDFVARYTLYKHLIENEGMSANKAWDIVVEAFIAYDVPLNRYIKYTNDMGLILFVRYWLRIQSVGIKLIKDEPASVAFAMLMENTFDVDPADILESHILLGNLTPPEGGINKILEELVVPPGWEFLTNILD